MFTLSPIYLLLSKLLTSYLEPFSAANSLSIRRRHYHFLFHRRNCLLGVLPSCDMALPEANSGVLSVYLRNLFLLGGRQRGSNHVCPRPHPPLASHLVSAVQNVVASGSKLASLLDGLRVTRLEVILRALFCRLIRCLTAESQPRHKLHT